MSDFRDLVRLLETHPEWRAELRRLVLSEELLELPALVRRIADRLDAVVAAQDALTRQLIALSEKQARTEERLSALVEAQARTEERLGALVEAQARTEGRVGELERRMGDLAAAQARTEDRLATIDGRTLELKYERLAYAYFGRLARRVRVLEPSALADQLDAAVDAGQLTAGERDAVMLADLVVAGRRRDDQVEVYYLVEVSAGVGVDDVRRAAERARLLAKLGRPVVPVVAGSAITGEAVAGARAAGVWRALDGHLEPPDAA